MSLKGLYNDVHWLTERLFDGTMPMRLKHCDAECTQCISIYNILVV